MNLIQVHSKVDQVDSLEEFAVLGVREWEHRKHQARQRVSKKKGDSEAITVEGAEAFVNADACID